MACQLHCNSSIQKLRSVVQRLLVHNDWGIFKIKIIVPPTQSLKYMDFLMVRFQNQPFEINYITLMNPQICVHLHDKEEERLLRTINYKLSLGDAHACPCPALSGRLECGNSLLFSDHSWKPYSEWLLWHSQNRIIAAEDERPLGETAVF